MRQSTIRRLMTAQGFTVVETGGGCTAWRLANGDTEVLVTDDASHELGAYCTLEVYADGECLLSIGLPTAVVLREGRDLLAG